MSGFGGSAAASGSGTCVENKLAQPSASWRSRGVFERPTMLQGPELRPASAKQPLGRLWPATPAWFRHSEARARPGACCGRW